MTSEQRLKRTSGGRMFWAEGGPSTKVLRNLSVQRNRKEAVNMNRGREKEVGANGGTGR